jgi:predicted RNA-binding Zn-ribbon protein involved in translation (DUF1610 family)
MDCPDCGATVSESKGSQLSPAINMYSCTCGWSEPRCGRSSCDGYLKAEEGYESSARYNCTKCDWTGVGPRL